MHLHAKLGSASFLISTYHGSFDAYHGSFEEPIRPDRCHLTCSLLAWTCFWSILVHCEHYGRGAQTADQVPSSSGSQTILYIIHNSCLLEILCSNTDNKESFRGIDIVRMFFCILVLCDCQTSTTCGGESSHIQVTHPCRYGVSVNSQCTTCFHEFRLM